MFKDFLTALLEKMLTHLVKHPDFFTKKEGAQVKELENLSIPATFKKYLEKVSAKEFMADLEVVTAYIHNPKNAQIKENEFFKHFAEFLTLELARKIDHLDSNFYLLSKKKRDEIIEKLISGESQLAKSLKTILTNYTYQQLAAEIIELGVKVAAAPYLVVQSPREIDSDLKREIRTQLTEKYPLSFPAFQVNKKIIGGIRIFHNGQTSDHSWLSRVLRFTSLTTA